MKKLISALLCLCMAFTFISGIPFAGTSLDTAVTAEAASYNTKMLPYYYDQLSKSEKENYLKIRQAYINTEKSLKISLDEKELEKLLYIIWYFDPLTSLQKKEDHSCSYATLYGKVTKVEFSYRYSQKEYKKLIKYADSVSEKVISGFTDKMSTYDKILYINDYICKKCVYNENGSHIRSIYGALSKGEAVCDGYNHAFAYICAKAGIKTASVLGTSYSKGKWENHIWSKVYYNKKWYNVDVTWNDSSSNIKNDKYNGYFMVSDKAISDSHKEETYGFKYPSAKDDSRSYYVKKGLYAESKDAAKKLLISKIAKSADKGVYNVKIMLKNGISFSDEEMGAILRSADKSSKAELITGAWLAGSEKLGGSTVYSVYFFKKNSKISDYYINAGKVDKSTADFLASLGIKNK